MSLVGTLAHIHPCAHCGADNLLLPPQILLYMPNLVGYARAGLLAAVVRVGTSDPVTCCYLCLANMVLDGVDGALARALHQASLAAIGRRSLTGQACITRLWVSFVDIWCSHVRPLWLSILRRRVRVIHN